MKKLTPEEFQDRVEAIARAEKIFVGSGITNNITEAFKIYQTVFAERERQILLMSEHLRNPSIFDKFHRPLCPDCSNEMLFRLVPENDEGVKTQLVCSNPLCDVVLNSDKSVDDWIEVLTKKSGE
jgi:hypothetical protein